MTLADLIIRPSDISDAGYCASGARRWFEAHGLDFRDFIANGVAAQVLLDTGDALAARVVELTLIARNAEHG